MEGGDPAMAPPFRLNRKGGPALTAKPTITTMTLSPEEESLLHALETAPMESGDSCIRIQY